MTTHLKLSSPYFYSNNLAKFVEANVLTFFDWGFTDYGAFTNVVPNVSGAYGDFSRLRRVDDPNFTTGTVWEGVRSNWVWESGLLYGTPLKVSGVFINNVFTSSGFRVDYPRGRIIFDTAKSASTIVRCGHSYKEVQFIPGRDNPAFKQIQINSRTPSNTNFLANSGNYIGLATNKVNLPCVSLEIDNRRNSPYQIGGGNWTRYTATFTILGESDVEVSKIADILCDQEEKIFFAFDLDLMATSGAFPLKHDGSLNTNPKCYPDLVKVNAEGGYRTTKVDQGKIRLYDSNSKNGKWLSQNLYMNVVKTEVEVIVPPN